MDKTPTSNPPVNNVFSIRPGTYQIPTTSIRFATDREFLADGLMSTQQKLHALDEEMSYKTRKLAEHLDDLAADVQELNLRLTAITESLRLLLSRVPSVQASEESSS